MKKKLFALILGLCSAAVAYGQISNPPRYIVGTTIVSGLPAAASAKGQFWGVTDGASSSDCTTGSGTTAVVCESNGSTWTAVSGSGGGGGVSQIIAGTNVTVSPAGGTGAVTVDLPANVAVSGTLAAGTSNPVTIGGATGSCSGLYAKADGTGCGNPGGGSGGVTFVICAGTNDTAAIQTALNGAGHVVVAGACVMGASSGHLTIKSNTWLDTGSATISYAPPSWDYIIGNPQNSFSPQRTFADAVVTAGSASITSASAAFTSADVGLDITCTNAIVPASYQGGPTYPTLITRIQSVTNGTTVVLSNTPTASSNPSTCNIYVRDHDIKISGGHWYKGGANVSNTTGNEMQFILINDLTIRDLYIQDGLAGTTGSLSGSKLIAAWETSRVLIENCTFYTGNLLQDGIDIHAPADSVVINNIKGGTGDDFVAVTGAGLFGYAPITGVTISNLFPIGLNGLKLFSNDAGTAMPITNLTLSHLKGISLATGVTINGGTMDNMLFDDIGGNIALRDVWVLGGQLGTLTLKNLSQNWATNNPSGALVTMAGIVPINIANLIIDGISSDGYAMPSQINIGAGAGYPTVINQMEISNVNLNNLGTGQGSPIFLGSSNGTQVSILDLSLNHVKINYSVPVNVTMTLAGLISNRVSLHDVHVTFNLASGTTYGELLEATASGALAGAIGDIVMDDVSLVSNQTITNGYLVLQSGTQVQNSSITNARLSNVSGCWSGTLAGVNQLVNVTTSALSTPSSCMPNSTGIAAVVASTYLTNQTASIPLTTLYTTSGLHTYWLNCTIWTGSVSGNATVNVNSAGAVYYPSPTITLASGANTSLAFPLIGYPSGSGLGYHTVFTAGTGGNYNLFCTVTQW